MSIITRYISLSIVKWFSVCCFGVLALFLFIDFFEKTRHFAKHDARSLDIFYYVLLSVPEVSLQFIPYVLLLSTMFALIILYRNNEIIAMQSCGMSFVQVAWPGIGFAMVMALARVYSILL